MGNISQYDSGEQCGPWASCLFVLCPSQKTFTPMETSPLPEKGCRVSAFASLLRAFEQVGSLSCHNCYAMTGRCATVNCGTVIPWCFYATVRFSIHYSAPQYDTIHLDFGELCELVLKLCCKMASCSVK
jgi:hypothetical protein